MDVVDLMYVPELILVILSLGEITSKSCRIFCRGIESL